MKGNALTAAAIRAHYCLIIFYYISHYSIANVLIKVNGLTSLTKSDTCRMVPCSSTFNSITKKNSSNSENISVEALGKFELVLGDSTLITI